ncbi:MAG: SWIB/MDM2 domain-containing protein [candidate division Zixibacteria bacterium]|nr:SWIB/MDM2 domain-containing protein [candidate division Zixibacteria bacterium]
MPKKAGKKSAKKRVVKKKAAKKPARKIVAKKKMAAKKRTPRKPNPAFMRPMQPDDMLGAVVGMKAIPRTEITKKLWDYIKRNRLQDNVNRRMINADDNLKAVFGGKRQVSMFEMTKLVSKHMS